MSKIKIKIITGFRENQFYSIDADEAHKAYYLFTHPEERGVFENGVALIGKNIQGIEPDWNAIMEYNPDYELDYEDWNELRSTGLERRAKEALVIAKDVARMVDEKPQLINEKLSEIATRLGINKINSSPESKLLAEKLSYQLTYKNK